MMNYMLCELCLKAITIKKNKDFLTQTKKELISNLSTLQEVIKEALPAGKKNTM